MTDPQREESPAFRRVEDITEPLVVSIYPEDRELSDFAFERGEKVVYSPLKDQAGDTPWTIVGRDCQESILWRKEHDLAPRLPDHRTYTLRCIETGERRTITEGTMKASWTRLAEVETDGLGEPYANRKRTADTRGER